MSEPAPPASPQQPRRRSTAFTVLMVIAGLILLLPGVCVLGLLPTASAADVRDLTGLWLACLAISAVGVWILVRAIRGPKVRS